MIISSTAIVLIVVGAIVFSVGVGIFICYYQMQLEDGSKGKRKLSSIRRRGVPARKFRQSLAELGQIKRLGSVKTKPSNDVSDGRRLSASDVQISYDMFKVSNIPNETLSPPRSHLKPLKPLKPIRHVPKDVRDSPILEELEDEGPEGLAPTNLNDQRNSTNLNDEQTSTKLDDEVRGDNRFTSIKDSGRESVYEKHI